MVSRCGKVSGGSGVPRNAMAWGVAVGVVVLVAAAAVADEPDSQYWEAPLSPSDWDEVNRLLDEPQTHRKACSCDDFACFNCSFSPKNCNYGGSVLLSFLSPLAAECGSKCARTDSYHPNDSTRARSGMFSRWTTAACHFGRAAAAIRAGGTRRAVASAGRCPGRTGTVCPLRRESWRVWSCALRARTSSVWAVVASSSATRRVPGGGGREPRGTVGRRRWS